jgi:hypothetical protein
MTEKKIQPTNPAVATSEAKDAKDAEDEKASTRKTAAVSPAHYRKSGRKTNTKWS